MLTDKQKNKAMVFLRQRQADRNFEKGLCFCCGEYLDSEESFTDFTCGPVDKNVIMDMVRRIHLCDGSANVYIEVYDLEEDDTESFIYAETMWIQTVLDMDRLKDLFEELNKDYGAYCSPDAMGVLSEESIHRYFLVNQVGELIEMSTLLNTDGLKSLFYCWWD